MKVDAHPLVVAVALGMLGPAALLDEDDRDEAECLGCELEDDKVVTTEGWQPGPAPSADEFHRVELEWLKQG
jgi:hypothetical protein